MKLFLITCNKNYLAKNIFRFNTSSKKYSLFILIFFFNVFSIVANKNRERIHILYNSFEIRIKINGTGEQNIISQNYNYCPNFVYLNDLLVDITENCHKINIPAENDEINLIKLIWNVGADSLKSIFQGLENLTEVDLSNYDTSSITDMSYMFHDSYLITSINLNNINTSLVEDMSCMFYFCDSLKDLDLSSFITTKVINMSLMFFGCSEITSLNISNFDTSNVLDMDLIFGNMYSLKDLNISNFDTSKITSMASMFKGCFFLTSLDLSSFNTSLVNDMSGMFEDNLNLISLNLSNFDTSNVLLMNDMFRNCISLEFLDISKFNTLNVINMDYMFYTCRKLEILNLSNFKTPNLISMNELFYDCNNLYILDLSNFNTTSITTMEQLFFGCNSLVSLNLSSFDTSNVKNMSNMFSNCYYLISIDLSKFNTKSVNDFSDMFQYCIFLTSLDLFHFDTSNAIRMDGMFLGCSYLKYLNISSFDTHSVETMKSMFYDCRSLTSLDLSSFDTSKVTDMYTMFMYNKELKELNLSNFNTSSVTNIIGMFFMCEKLEYINLKIYNEINDINVDLIFDYLQQNLVICIDENNSISSILEELNTKSCPTIYCGNDWKSKQKKIAYENNLTICVDNCSNYKYELNNICYSYCPESVDFCVPENETENITNNFNLIESSDSIHENNDNITEEISISFNISFSVETDESLIKCELEQCQYCSIDSLNMNLCISCNTGYYPIFNDDLNNNSNSYKNCSKSPEGYFLDIKNLVYKPCYQSCKKCYISGNDIQHNCIECKYDNDNKINFGTYKNCYDSFIENFICPEIYDKLIEAKKECVSNCSKDEIYKYEFKKKCYEECPQNTTKRDGDDEDKYFCKPICNEEFPFEIISRQECVKNCEIKDIIDKSCILNYIQGENKEKEKEIAVYNIIIENIADYI